MIATSEVMGGEEDEALALKAVVKRYFSPSPSSAFIAWLFFEAQTGNGLALAVGRFIPKPGVRKKIYCKGLGIAPVPLQFQQTILDFGPQALRWNGKEIVVNGN